MSFFPEFQKSGFDGRNHEQDASLDLLLPPGLGRGTENKRVRHEHQFGRQPDWRRGGQGLVCGGLRRMLNAAASHEDVMFSTSSDSDKFGWFAGAVVSSFISDRVELSNTPDPAVWDTVCRC